MNSRSCAKRLSIKRSPLLSDSFDILISIVGEQNVRDGEFLDDAIPQRQYVNNYYSAQGERERVELTNRIVHGGKKYLESRSVCTRPVLVAAHSLFSSGSKLWWRRRFRIGKAKRDWEEHRELSTRFRHMSD